MLLNLPVCFGGGGGAIFVINRKTIPEIYIMSKTKYSRNAILEFLRRPEIYHSMITMLIIKILSVIGKRGDSVKEQSFTTSRNLLHFY